MINFDSSLRYRLTESSAVRLRVAYALIALVSFIDTFEVVSVVSTEQWRPNGVLAPVLNFVVGVFGLDAVLAIHPYTAVTAAIGLIALAIGIYPRAFSALATLSALVGFSITVAARGIRHPEAPLIMSLFLSALTAWPAYRRLKTGSTFDLWPIHQQRAIFAFVFFASGLQKIWLSAEGWLGGHALKHHLLWAQLAYAHMEPSALQLTLNHWLASFPDAVLGAIGWTVVLAEVMLPFFLYWKPTRAPVLLVLLFMVIMFRLTLFVPFNGIYVMFVFWLRRFDEVRA